MTIKKMSKDEIKNYVNDGVSGKTEGDFMAEELLNDYNRLHSQYHKIPKDYATEKMLLDQDRYSLHRISEPLKEPEGVKFRPSGVSSADMDLWLEAMGYKEDKEKYPYQVRWARNGNAVHDYIQRDLLYMEKHLSNPAFTVNKVTRDLNGETIVIPAWEDGLLKCVPFTDEKYPFYLKGMMDGILTHSETRKSIGFEFKTKSTTIGQVGNYLMKDAKDYHKEQCIVYSIMYGLDEFIIMYESLAKDGWTKGVEAKPDIRAFHIKVTDEDRERVLNRFRHLSELIYTEKVPDNKELGFFSGYADVVKQFITPADEPTDETNEKATQKATAGKKSKANGKASKSKKAPKKSTEKSSTKYPAKTKKKESKEEQGDQLLTSAELDSLFMEDDEI